MSVPTEAFKINLNQNLWGLIGTYIALGLADYYSLSALFWLSGAASVVMTISVVITNIVYTCKYCKNKFS